MPDDYRRYGESWSHHHPGWDMRLWTDADAATLECEHNFARARTYPERSDILRYEVLRLYGGVYVDTDLECLRPIDDLLDGVSAFTAYLRPGRPKLGTAIMGCEPAHPAFEQAAERVSDWVGVGRKGDTGPWLMTEIVGEFPDVTVFDAELFYPYHWTELHRRYAEFPDAYAVHHWSPRFLEKLERRHDAAVVKNTRLITQNRELRERLGRTKKELAKTSAKLATQKRARKEAEARLRAFEASRWWQSRVFLERQLGRLRPSGNGHPECPNGQPEPSSRAPSPLPEGRLSE